MEVLLLLLAPEGITRMKHVPVLQHGLAEQICGAVGRRHGRVGWVLLRTEGRGEASLGHGGSARGVRGRGAAAAVVAAPRVAVVGVALLLARDGGVCLRRWESLGR